MKKAQNELAVGQIVGEVVEITEPMRLKSQAITERRDESIRRSKEYYRRQAEAWGVSE